MSEVWEPVEQAGLVDGRGDVLKIRTTGDGKQSVYAESDDGWVWMPDAPVKYRICRANHSRPCLTCTCRTRKTPASSCTSHHPTTRRSKERANDNPRLGASGSSHV